MVQCVCAREWVCVWILSGIRQNWAGVKESGQARTITGSTSASGSFLIDIVHLPALPLGERERQRENASLSSLAGTRIPHLSPSICVCGRRCGCVSTRILMLSSSVSSFSWYRNSADREPKGDAVAERRNPAKLLAVVIHSVLSSPETDS